MSNKQNKVGEKRIALRVLYTRETDLLFEDNIPKYADWLEIKLAEYFGNINELLKKYFKDTPREKVLENWAKSEKFDNIGPTRDEFLEQIQRGNDVPLLHQKKQV